MASKEDIIALPHKNLRQKSKSVAGINKSILKLIDDMKDATLSWEDSRKHEQGVALAAVQINKLLKVIIIRNNFESKADRTFSAFINPKIIGKSKDKVFDFEGCLSVPDIYGKVSRYHSIEVEAQDIEGKLVKIKVEGFLARVFQHEIDHTEGILFIDKIKNKRKAFFNLNSEGKLTPLDYEKDIRKNRLLW